MATLCRLDVFLLFTFLNFISNSRTNASTDIEIEATDVVPAPFYPGEIDTADDGKISGATGKPVAE